MRRIVVPTAVLFTSDIPSFQAPPKNAHRPSLESEGAEVVARCCTVVTGYYATMTNALGQFSCHGTAIKGLLEPKKKSRKYVHDGCRECEQHLQPFLGLYGVASVSRSPV